MPSRSADYPAIVLRDRAVVTIYRGADTMSPERFPDLVAGETYGPLIVRVRDSVNTPIDLTGDSATITIVPVRGGAAILSGFAHTNTPGTAGNFEFQLAAAHTAGRYGEHEVKVTATIDGQTKKDTFLMLIKPF